MINKLNRDYSSSAVSSRCFKLGSFGCEAALFDDLRHVFLDLIVVPFDFLLHVVLTIRTGKVGYDGDRLVGFCFGGYPFIVHHDLAMEYLLFYLLPEVVADTADNSPCERLEIWRQVSASRAGY